MAYAEICTCIRTLQEAAFQQESEIFRLREREVHLKQLVKDLQEKLHLASSSRDAAYNGGTSEQASISGKPSVDSRVTTPTETVKAAEAQMDSKLSPPFTTGARSSSTTPTVRRKDIVMPSPKSDRKQLPDADVFMNVVQPPPSPNKHRAPTASLRQPMKVATKAASSPEPRAATHRTAAPPPDAANVRQWPDPWAMHRGSMDVKRRTLLSSDMETKFEDRALKVITQKYGDIENITRAALCIQRAYHAYKIRNHFAALVEQGPSVMRRRTNTITQNPEGKRVRRLTIMEDADPHLTRIGGMSSSFARVDSMARLREKSNLHKERPKTRRERLIHCGNAQSIANAADAHRESTDSVPLKADVQRAKSLKRLGGVYVDGRADHPLMRSQSNDDIARSSSTSSSSTSHNSLLQETIGINVQEVQKNIGIHLFNRKPTSGIQYLVSIGILADDPLSVAKFLHSQPGLSKQRIGEFLGEIRMEFNMAVLGHMATLIDMEKEPIDSALREFQKMFLMPGEAQKIDKIMQTFAAQYFKSNLGLMENEDAAYVLSFAIMMLHTSLHNPSVKHKTSLEQWVTMNRGNNGGKDFSKQFLLEIYERIKKTPFATGQDHTTVVMGLQKQLVGSPIHNLTNPQRSLVLKASVTVLDGTHGHLLKRKVCKRTLLIFNDLVIVAKRNKDQYTYKSSFPLFNTDVIQFNTEAAQYSIQINSVLEKKILLQCASETKEEHTVLLETLHNTIEMLEELEKARIAGLATKLDRISGSSKPLCIEMEDCDHLSSGNRNSQQQKSSVDFIVGVGDIQTQRSHSALSL